MFLTGRFYMSTLVFYSQGKALQPMEGKGLLAIFQNIMGLYGIQQ